MAFWINFYLYFSLSVHLTCQLLYLAIISIHKAKKIALRECSQEQYFSVPHLFQLDSSGFQWILLYSTGIYLWIDFIIFIYYILGIFQVIPDCSRLFQVIPVDSSTIQLKIATIFILDNICQHTRFSDILLLDALDMIFM